MKIDYKEMSQAEKISFFEKDMSITYTEGKLFEFFKSTIFSIEESSYVRKLALEKLVEYIFARKIKVRKGLSIIIDDWETTNDIFIELQRIKELYFFYGEAEEEIEEIYTEYLNSENYDIKSEAMLYLGLINMQKGLLALTEEKMFENLQTSKYFLIESQKNSENRIDSIIYEKSITAIIDFFHGNISTAEETIKEIASILFKKEAFSFNYLEDSVYISFYRAINALRNIMVNDVSKWLNYRHGFSEIFYQYSQIKNYELRSKLAKSKLYSSLVLKIDKFAIEPYFAMNFKSEIARIDSRLVELEDGTEEYRFLVYIKNTIESRKNDVNDKKESLIKELSHIFPLRNKDSIDDAVNKIMINNNPLELLSVYHELGKPSFKEFLDKLVFACIKLQGDRTYRGNKLEDDRNTRIGDMLEISGYIVKDQSHWSQSAKGINAGEIDLFILDKNRFPMFIIEALNLDSLDKNYIELHLNKIFTYDATGLKNNFIIVYSEAKKFSELWDKYTDFIRNYSYEYLFIAYEEIKNYPFTELRIGKTTHERNGMDVNLYHIMVNMQEF